jgi:hypothetical protein
MGFADRYIAKNRGEFFFEPTQTFPFRMIVVIPCYDEQQIHHTLLSLYECDNPGVKTGIVIVINSFENSPEEVLIQNKKTVNELHSIFDSIHSFLHLYVIEVENLPEKHGGVGWARKIGMDWAITHFNQFDFIDGIILSLDADTIVEKNYLTAVYNYFISHSDQVAATLYFEHSFHPYDLRTDILEEASVLYELYMRYYRNALSYTRFPNSIYTVGSCMAIKAGAYVAQGGMNRRKAGEDFYFLHKMALLGQIFEIKTTTVFPSSRISRRVPFGTGAALYKYCEGNHSLDYTFSIEAFEVLKSFFSDTEKYYKAGGELKSADLSDNFIFRRFSDEIKLTDELRELSANCGSTDIFKKRFFHVFNAFKTLKWLNYSLLNGIHRGGILSECEKLLKVIGIDEDRIAYDSKKMLSLFRELDKNCKDD